MLIDPNEFLEATQPPLASGDASALADEVNRRWSVEQVCSLLSSRVPEARRVAALVIGLIGDERVSGCLARGLHDRDEKVGEMAEHGLWAIWMRSCCCEASEPFQEALDAIEAEDFDRALERLDHVLAIDGDFAEAYNQKAIALFLTGRYEASIAMCREALERCPSHFGAMAGMGHGFAHLHEWEKALCCYRKALAINPNMPAIVSAVDRLQAGAPETESTDASSPDRSRRA
jgi:tetratricopeptide (TPR) repeat protein